jgi:ribosome modulation factor
MRVPALHTRYPEPIMDIENHPDYLAGRAARLNAQGRQACPYGGCMMRPRSTWLAGWHDADMELSA